MTKGRELPVNCKARRRLFSEDEADNPEQDGEITRAEYAARDLRNEAILMGMRWNFDFKNEVALDGPIQWYRKGSEGEWVGMQPTGRTLNMRKRKVDLETPTKAAHEDERSKVRRQSLLTGIKTREHFENERTQKLVALVKLLAEDDNQKYSFNEEFREEDQNTQDKRDGKTSITELEEVAENKAEVKQSAANSVRSIAMATDEFLPEGELVNLSISEIDDILQEVPERLEVMMNQNQATPKNEKNDDMPVARKTKKKQVLGKGTKKRINFD